MLGTKLVRSFADLPLALKLFVAPAVVVLFLIAIAALAFMGIAKQRDAIDDMHNKRFAMYDTSSDLVLELTRVNEGMLKVMTYSQVGYEEERIAKVVAEQTERLERVSRTIAEVLERPYLSPEEKAAFENLKKPFADYRMWSLRVMDMASGDIATAAVYLGTAELKFKSLRDVLTKLETQEVGLSNDYFAASQAAYRRTSSVFFVGIGLAVLFAIAVTVLVSRQIARPVGTVVHELARITDGEWDLTRRIAVTSRDEVSAVTLGINTFIEKLQSLIQKISTSTRLLADSSSKLTGVSESLSRHASATTQTTSGVVGTTQHASQNVTNISKAADAMSEDVSAMASAIEQMSASLDAVVKHCQDETNMAQVANEQATNTRQMMVALGQSTHEIGKIVELINSIAAQTNLLALNANIEAASAGAAGKGFAVVAREVKELALKTAKATGQIGSQIESIQQSTTMAGTSMEKISTVIEEINSISRTIVCSIEELSKMTADIAASTGRSKGAAVEIARNVAESAQGLSQATHDVKNVFESAEATSGKIMEVTVSAQELADLSRDLGHVVAQFKV